MLSSQNLSTFSLWFARTFRHNICRKGLLTIRYDVPGSCLVYVANFLNCGNCPATLPLFAACTPACNAGTYSAIGTLLCSAPDVPLNVPSDNCKRMCDWVAVPGSIWKAPSRNLKGQVIESGVLSIHNVRAYGTSSATISWELVWLLTFNGWRFKRHMVLHTRGYCVWFTNNRMDT